MKTTLGQDLWPLLQALGAPERTREVVIRIPCDDVVTVEYTTIDTDGRIGKVIEEITRAKKDAQ